MIFAYESGRLLQGDVIYRDFFEFTFPGTQALYASIFFLFGQKYWILPAVILGIGVSYAGALLLTISKRITIGPLAYMPALIFIFFGYRWFGLDGTHRMLSPIFILLAIWVLLREQNLWHLAAAGIFCALASFFTQQRGIAAFIAISTFVCLDAFFQRRKLKRTIPVGRHLWF